MIEWWLLATARISALMFTAPWLGQRVIPVWVRLLMCLTTSIVILPLVPEAPLTGRNTIDWIPGLMRELAIGIALGVGLGAIVHAAETVGQIASQMAGLQWVDTADSGEESAPLARLLQWLAVVLFIVIQGPERLVSALLDSCQVIPIGQQEVASWPAAQWLLTVLRQSLWLALRGVGPLVAVTLATHLALGILGRMAPQLGLFQAGLSVNLIAFWLTLILLVSGCGWLFDAEISAALDQMQRVLLSGEIALTMGEPMAGSAEDAVLGASVR